jgi:hypothetical protein
MRMGWFPSLWQYSLTIGPGTSPPLTPAPPTLVLTVVGIALLGLHRQLQSGTSVPHQRTVLPLGGSPD